jgi:hypothetical protein
MASTQEVPVSADANSAKISELAARYVSDNLRLWQQYGEGLRRVSEGAIPRADTAARAEVPRSDIPTFARQLMQLNLTHYSELLNTYAEFTNRILTTVFQAPDAPSVTSAAATPSPAPAPAGARIELEFTGVTGESVSQSFAVANKKAEPIDVAFEVTEFVSENGASRFRAPVMFAPDVFVLSPGAERIVECRLALTPAFVPGTRYLALVRVIGFPALETALIVVPLRTATPGVERNTTADASTTIETSAVTTVHTAAAKATRSRKGGTAGSRKRRTRRKTPPPA